MQAEQDWALANAILGGGSLSNDPLDAADIEAAVTKLSSTVAAEALIKFSSAGRTVPIADLLAAAKRVAGLATPIASPWPGRDQAPSGWIWSGYSPERLRERVHAVFTAGLEAHEWLAVNVLPAVAPLLATHAARPAVARIALYPADASQGFQGSPGVNWRLNPLPWSAANCVEVTLASRNKAGTHWGDDGPWREYERMRPHALAFTGLVQRNSILDVFGATPATDLAYQLLHDDLKTIRWLN